MRTAVNTRALECIDANGSKTCTNSSKDTSTFVDPCQWRPAKLFTAVAVAAPAADKSSRDSSENGSSSAA